MCDKYDFNSERNEITVHGSCSAIFTCNGAPVKCESVELASTCMGSRGYAQCSDESNRPRSKINEYVPCAAKCNAPNLPVGSDDNRRRLRRRRLHGVHTTTRAPDHPIRMCSEPEDPSRRRRLLKAGWKFSGQSDFNTCIDCIRRCMGCRKTCQCSNLNK